MRRLLITVFTVLTVSRCLAGTLLINEIAPATSGDDWVELVFVGECGESINIAPLFVTMYYGTGERLSDDPITLHACDRPQTPYDDRFAVVHLTAPGMADETDLTGDANRNGYIDIYCNNYSGSLWNTDCVVAIDTDNDASNGGILDFAAYSNRDGSLNSSIGGYLAHAQKFNAWEPYSGENPQFCMVDIGQSGLQSHQSVVRMSESDTNRKEDFAITNYQTPGWPNKISVNSSSSRLFDVPHKRITILPGHPIHGTCEIPLTAYHPISLRFRIFSPIGLMIFESPLEQNIAPGPFVLRWNLIGAGHNAGTGLYFAVIEATNSSLRRSQRETVYLIVSRYQ